MQRRGSGGIRHDSVQINDRINRLLFDAYVRVRGARCYDWFLVEKVYRSRGRMKCTYKLIFVCAKLGVCKHMIGIFRQPDVVGTALSFTAVLFKATPTTVEETFIFYL